MEASALLRGSASNAEVSLSHSLLVIDDTYVGLETQAVVTIRNDSDVPVDFSWRLFPSVTQERQYRAELQARLKLEERDETLYMQQARDGEDSSDDSCSDEERLRARREAKVSSGLGRKYGNISKAVTEDPMLFRDTTFVVAPASGRIWAHSQLTCACSFCPRDALVYSCTAYLSCVGRDERAPLVLRGLGIGPKATFSYNELDVGSVFVESAHRYEVQLLNQGDIEVDFRLQPPREHSTFGSQFHFEPRSGTIEVAGQCEIVVDFKPGDLGDFHETFSWTLKGSATAVTLAFRGRSVVPTFTFDVASINFGTVSFGFLNSRMLTLMNTAEVPIFYNMRVPGDALPPDTEFTLIPWKGTLLPNCAQRVQVDFVSLTEKKYDMRLAVDLEGVGKELAAIPITAQCSVPQVSFEPHGCLSYGDIFIRYPFHQSLYLHNTSTLPAKFEVMPQEDRSRAEFEPDQWVGTVPPCASHVITVTLTAHGTGAVRIPMYVKIHGRSVPFPLVLVANTIGPRVVVEPAVVDWGQVKCLEPMVRHVRLKNNSCIDAHVRAFMNERKSLWRVHPKIIHLSPQETLQLALTLVIDECCVAQDVLNLVVNEGDDLSVNLKGKGIDTPIRCDHPLDSVDFGMMFTTHQQPKDIVIRNHGKYPRTITWVREKEKKDKKEDNKKAPADPEKVLPPVFRVDPERFTIDPRSAFRFTLLAQSPTPGIVEDSLTCNETPDAGGAQARMVFKPNFRAHFVAPVLKVSRSELVFKFFWERDKPVEPMSDTIELTNATDLEIGFKVQVAYPFTTDIGDYEERIPPRGTVEILVFFDPAYSGNRKSSTKKDKMVIQYEDHPSTNVVDLVGKVVWPNIEIDATKIDFGHVLNDCTRKKELKMHNPTALTVAYNWYFHEEKKPEGASNPRTPATGSNLLASAASSLAPPEGFNFRARRVRHCNA
jgi:hydrocephalus-inducing protein